MVGHKNSHLQSAGKLKKILDSLIVGFFFRLLLIAFEVCEYAAVYDGSEVMGGISTAGDVS